MALDLSAHDVQSVRLSKLRIFGKPGNRFYSQELVIINKSAVEGESSTTITLYYNENPGHCLDGEIVSKEPLSFEVDIVERKDDVLELEV